MDFGKSANSSAIEVADVVRPDCGNTAKACAIELAGVNKSVFSASSFAWRAVWLSGLELS
jgi:hypothetical protein